MDGPDSRVGKHSITFRALRQPQFESERPLLSHMDIAGRQIWRTGIHPKGTLSTGSAGLAVGGAYLAVAAGVDHLVTEFGVARQDAPVDRAGGGDDLAVAAQ